ncbi:MAG: hypothetical protein IPJ25_13650 [Rhodocyclaceae bacterium]|nr:hypothetical protein [Rhodocyclaceae bacterium]
MNLENDEIGFIYSFDMSEEIADFKLLPEHIRSSAECNAVDVIYESFVVPADQDYLMSRLLAQNGLPRGFYWAAAQAIEKYLKAFLLMNGEGVKGFKAHPIKALFKAASKIDISLADLNILPHRSIQVEVSVSHHLRNLQSSAPPLSFQLREKIGAIPIVGSFKKLSPDLVLSFEKNNPWFQAKKTNR